MFEQIAANRRKSVVLIVVMAVLLLALGFVLGEVFFGEGAGYAGLVIAAIVWFIMTLVATFQGDRIFLGMSGAKKIEKQDLPVLWNVVEEMSLAAGMARMPAVYVIDDPAPNAFATGRKEENAAVAVTSGLLRVCNRDELQGVMAHEIGHVRNRDIQLMLYAGVLVGAIVILADIGLRSFLWSGGGRSRRSSDGGGQAQIVMVIVAVALMILAPIFAQLIYFAVSRKREYLADATAAVYTRYPEGLASALEKISAAPQKLASASKATAPMYIINPLKRTKKKRAADATSTHPPITERVRILRSMTQAGFAAYDESFRSVSGKKSGVIPKSVFSGAGLRVGRMAEELRGPGEAGVGATAGATSGATAGAKAATEMPGMDLAALAAIAAAEAEARRKAGKDAGDSVAGSRKVRERAREVDDFFYREQGYQRLDCPCGAVLKIPPGFTSTRVRCTRCGRQHEVSAFGYFSEPA